MLNFNLVMVPGGSGLAGGMNAVQIENGSTLAQFATKYDLSARELCVDNEMITRDRWSTYVLGPQTLEVFATKSNKGN
jgi:hypothetical protein